MADNQRRRGCTCLPLLLIIIGLTGLAAWTGIIPVRDFVHLGAPISIPVNDNPTLFIYNSASSSSELRQRDPAPVHVSASTLSDSITIEATNLPLVGARPITYRQSTDKTFITLTIAYNYKGSIDITVPENTNIKFDSHESGISIDGINGSIVIDTHKGDIQVTDTILSGSSLFKTYEGSITLEKMTLNYASIIETYKGDITFQGNLAPTGHHFIETYSGHMTITLPTDSAFYLDASSFQSEAVITDFPGLQTDEGTTQGSTGQAPQAYLHLYSYEQAINLQRGQE